MRVLLIASPAGGPPDLAHADALVLAHPPPAPPGWLPAARARMPLYVRVAPGAADLDAALALAPDGLVLPGVSEAGDVARLGARLAVHEAEAGLPDGATRIVAGLDGAGALLRFGGASGRLPRLAGLFCPFDALARDLGLASQAPCPRPCPTPRPAPAVAARGLLVLAAAALGVPAFDATGPVPDRDAARAARRDEFRGAFAETAAAAAVFAQVFEEGFEDGYGDGPGAAGGPLPRG